MRLKNNSSKEWLNYNCGHEVFVDIKANSEFEVNEDSAKVILRNLGAETWVTKVGEEPKVVEIEMPVEVEVPIEVKETEVEETEVKEVEAPKEKKAVKKSAKIKK